MSLSSSPTPTLMFASAMTDAWVTSAGADSEDWSDSRLLVSACAGGSFGWAAARSRSTRSSKAWFPSSPVDSIDARNLRMASTLSRINETRAGDSCILRERNWLSRFSAWWAIRSSLEKARKPQVPLMVWTVRKILLSRLESSGRASSSTSSRSRRERFS